ncbi:MAG: beta-lactamase family protein [Candidatus Latescibacterota bacterium]|nr:MAG: beta-lactamase family protein [Candidatus Latescibacterota bacterium]
MIRHAKKSLPLLVLVLILIPVFAVAQDPDSPGPRETRMVALEKMINAAGRASMEKFIDDHIDASLLNTMTCDALLDLLGQIRAKCAAAGGITVEPDGDYGVEMTFMTPMLVHLVKFEVLPEPPHKITMLSIEDRKREQQSSERWTWEDFASRLDKAAADGFSGTVLVVRNGEVALHRGYGYADANDQVPNSENTVFAIGSTPIDFTRAAILKLEERGKLETSDPISKYFPDVPPDKATMTIDHILESRSGLPNFHHIPGTDADPDLAWIDRDEAVRRILGKELLFAPGEGEAHSHSAWTLLAALVELASEQSYIDFLEKHFFEPLEMRDTGLYQKTQAMDKTRVAVGRVPTPFESNSPANWGNTSWLVMGSGGMVSTCADLYKWQSSLYSGDVLSAQSRDKYQLGGVFAGGNDRGFFCMFAMTPDAMMFMCSNADVGDGDDPARRVGRGLARLVMSQ